jgi:hypothetical protein
MPPQKPPPFSLKAGSKGAAGAVRDVLREKRKSGKNRAAAADPPPASPKAMRMQKAGGGCSSARSASQDALDEAQLANDQDLEKTPSPPPARDSGRARKVAEVQKARNDEKMVADLNARLSAENATLKAQLEKEKKRKEPSNVEAANPKQLLQKLSNANTQRRQMVMFSLFDISLQSFQWLPFS